MAIDTVVVELPVHPDFHLVEIAVGAEPPGQAADERERVEVGPHHVQIDVGHFEIEAAEPEPAIAMGDRGEPSPDPVGAVPHVELGNPVFGDVVVDR